MLARGCERSERNYVFADRRTKRKRTGKSHAEMRSRGGRSRSERKMKGGNEASETSEVTLCLKCATPIDAAENLHGWRPSLGAFAGTRNNLFCKTTAPRPAGSRLCQPPKIIKPRNKKIILFFDYFSFNTLFNSFPLFAPCSPNH